MEKTQQTNWRDEAVRHLRLLGFDKFEIRIIKDGKAITRQVDRQQALALLEKYRESSKVFVGVNPRVDLPANRAGGNDDVAALANVMLDFDSVNGASPGQVVEVAKALAARIAEKGHQAPAILSTGEGAHLIFAVPPRPLENGNRPAIGAGLRGFETWARSLLTEEEQRFAVIDTTSDLARVERLAGNVNEKNGQTAYLLTPEATRREDAALLGFVLRLGEEALKSNTGAENPLPVETLEEILLGSSAQEDEGKVIGRFCEGLPITLKQVFELGADKEDDRSTQTFALCKEAIKAGFGLCEWRVIAEDFDSRCRPPRREQKGEEWFEKFEVQGLYEKTKAEVAEEQQVTTAESGEDQNKAHFKDLTDLLANPPAPPSWLVQDILPKRARFLIAGPPKVGKSWVTLELALCVATGRRVFDAFETKRPGRVMVISLELGEADLYYRVQRLNDRELAAGRIRFCTDPMFRLTDKRSVEWLISEGKSFSPDLILIDPLFSAFDGDENSAKDMRPALQGLDQIRYELKTSVAVTHHLRKRQQGNLQAYTWDDIRGSGALAGWFDSAMLLTPRSEDPLSFSAQMRHRNWKATGGFGGLLSEVDNGLGLRFEKVSLADLAGQNTKRLVAEAVAQLWEAGEREITRARLVDYFAHDENLPDLTEKQIRAATEENPNLHSYKSQLGKEGRSPWVYCPKQAGGIEAEGFPDLTDDDIQTILGASK